MSLPYHLMEKHCFGSGPGVLLKSTGRHLAGLSPLLHHLLCIQLFLYSTAGIQQQGPSVFRSICFSVSEVKGSVYLCFSGVFQLG